MTRFEMESKMRYAVKITATFNGKEMSAYAGLCGKSSFNIKKIEGWKKRESAEKYIAVAKQTDKYADKRTYEIITL